MSEFSEVKTEDGYLIHKVTLLGTQPVLVPMQGGQAFPGHMHMVMHLYGVGGWGDQYDMLTGFNIASKGPVSIPKSSIICIETMLEHNEAQSVLMTLKRGTYKGAVILADKLPNH